MKRITGFILGLALAFAGAGRIAGDTPPGMVPQPQPFSTGGGPSVPGTVNWQGVPGRTYQMQWSTNLQDWTYLPLTEEGAGMKSYGTMFSSSKAFTRLLCSDETPDLAKGTSWAPPLLTVTGQWKVSTIAQNPSTGGGAQAAGMLPASQTPSSIPVPGVNLTFYRWNAGASAPDTTPIMVAPTVSDGSYTFDPYAFTPAFGTGDRVQVCISGSPNQRVYLPSDLVGSEIGDPAAPGGGSGGGFPYGTGLPIPNITPSPNPGAIPVFNVPPDNTPNSSQVPAIRLADVLTQTQSQTDHLLDTSISPYIYNTQEIGQKVWPVTIGMLSSTNYYTSSHPLVNNTWNDSYSSVNTSLAQVYSNWLGLTYDQDAYRIHMNYSLLDPTYQDADKTYQNTLSADFTSGDFVRPVKMNVFINPGNIPRPSAYQPGIFSFKKGAQCDMGSAAIPYSSDLGGVAGPSRERRLVMGPVPMNVPESVMGGGIFYYDNSSNIKFDAELPFALNDMYTMPLGFPGNGIPCTVVWTAKATTTAPGIDPPPIKITDGTTGNNSAEGTTESIETTDSDFPHVTVQLQQSYEQNFTPYTQNFALNISAKLKVATSRDSKTGAPTSYALYDLGSFDTYFNYVSSDGGETTLSFMPIPQAALKQAAQIRGFTGNTPEGDGFNGGQRGKTLEPERKIGIDGQPAPNSPTFVDALTGIFHHSETDYSLPVPGSDLSLSVNRSLVDTIWMDSVGLHPDEDPLLAFGPGWDTNLASSVVRVSSLQPDGTLPTPGADNRLLNSTITVRDYQGASYTFLDYTDGNGNHSFITDPTLIPDRSSIGISLSQNATTGNLTLTQPLLGITHVFQASSVNFKVPNNRDTLNDGVTNPTGFSGRQYYRLASVTDRFGVTLNYDYGGNPMNLIPQIISVAGRSALQLRIQQNNGKIQAFWDPSGVKHTYTYDDRNLAGTGQGTATFHILRQHNIGPMTAASYGYNYSIEGDPRPTAMLFQTSGSTPYSITTRHIAPKSITNGVGNTVAVNYQLSTVRSSWSGAAGAFYHPAGDPLLVSSITLPDQTPVVFTLQHTLQYAPPGASSTSNNLSIVTQVTDVWGSQWTYSYDPPSVYTWNVPSDDVPYLPSASALFFPKLTRSCSAVPNSAVQFTYDASAGFALSQTTDAAGRNTSESHGQAYNPTTSIYTRPLVSGSASIHNFTTLPSTTTDVLGHTTTYHYPANSGGLLGLLPDTITDSSNRSLHITRDTLARTQSITRYSAANALLSQVDYSYGSGFPGVITQITRKAISGSSDPVWVTDLVKDIHPDTLGFPSVVGNDAQNLHTSTIRGPSGRVLSETAPDGGTRSYVYDASGLLVSTSLEDGSQIIYQHDPVGRTIITRDALGRATGIGYDSRSRVVMEVRSRGSNLAYSSQSFGGLTGVSPNDIVYTVTYQDRPREVCVTDPRWNNYVYSYDPLGHLTQIYTPPNTWTGGNFTSLVYDLSKSPDHPVLVTDPLGYQTIYKYDNYARPILTLRQYDLANNLYSGTSYGYDAATGLPNSITTTRTPLHANGSPLNSPLQQVTTSTIYDALDRPYTTTFAPGSTDKELKTKTAYTSTGLPYQKAVRDDISTDHWSTSTLVYDSLGRPVQEILPQTSEVALGTNIQAQPNTEIAYNNFGRLSQTSDAYGNVTTYGHDICGHLSYQKAPAVLDARSGLTMQPVTTYQYDAAGQLIKRVDPLGYAWQYAYDFAGRLVTTTGPVVSPDKASNLRRAVWQYEYDKVGNLIHSTDPEGNNKGYSYYAGNALAYTGVLVSLADGSPQEVVYEEYERDTVGHLTCLYDGNNQTTAFTYDGLGRKTSTTRDPYDNRWQTDTTVYDALLPTATIDANGQTKNYLYDAQFRLQGINVANHPEQSLSFIHDLLGRVTNIAPTNPSLNTSPGNPSIGRSYDVLGRLLTENSNGVTTSYEYDMSGQLAHITNDANSREIFIHHDAAGRTSQVDDYYGSPLFPLTTRFGYDLAGHQVVESMPNNLQKIAQLDPMGRVTCQTLLAANLNEITHTETQYDLLSNVTHIKEAFAPSLNIPGRTVDNTYNERSQLLSENQSETGGPLLNSTRTRVTTHIYDAAENRISTQSSIHDPLTTDSTLTRSFEYGSTTNGANSNQLYQLTETPLGGSSTVTNYGYDANGNRTTRMIGSLSDLYQYDSFNRLTQLTLTTTGGDNGIYQYSYDPLTRRISRTVGNTSNTQQFAFSGSTPAHEWHGAQPPSSAGMSDLIGGGLDSQLHIQDSNGVTTYPIQNLRGDITSQVNNAGGMSWHGTYSADGLLQNQYLTRIGDYGANGKFEEPGGLLNEGFRYRDRLTGTFLTRDPAGFIDGPNDYNYIGHNPWSAWDPDGLAVYANPASLYGYNEPSGGTQTANSNLGISGSRLGTTTGGDPSLSGLSGSDNNPPYGPTVSVPVSGSVNPLPDMSNLRDINNFIAIWPALRLPPSHSGQNPSPGSLSAGDMFVFEQSAYNMPLPQLNGIGDNPKVDPRIRKLAQKISQSISVSNHDYKILSGTAFGISLMFFGGEEVGAGIEAGVEAGVEAGIESVVDAGALRIANSGATLPESELVNFSRWTAANTSGELVQTEFAFARGASVQTPGVTKSGEVFVRVGATEASTEVRAGSYAMPEATFNTLGQDPAVLKNALDLPGSAPRYFRYIRPPAGTPIQRGIVPGGEFGGVGGSEEVIFPKGIK